MKDNKVYLRHILDSIDHIENYLQGMEKESFLDGIPSLVGDGVVRQLEIIGEAARHVSEGFKTNHKELPWKEMVGMRNKIIHEYLSVDYLEVWNTAKNDLPALRENLLKVLG